MRDEVGEQNASMTRIMDAMLRNYKLILRPVEELDQVAIIRLLHYKERSGG